MSAILCGALRALARTTTTPIARTLATATPTTAERWIQIRRIALATPLARRRWQTRDKPLGDDCPKCRNWRKCQKKFNCMDPDSKHFDKCIPLPRCKPNPCKFVDPRAYRESQANTIAEEQMSQAREERRLRKCLYLRDKHCPKKRKKEHNVYKGNCPKDHSDRRR